MSNHADRAILTVTPSPGLRGSATVPGDKSISHRAALFSALAAGESRIDNFLDAGVTRRMLAALSALSVPWTLEGTRLTVQGTGMSGLRAPEGPLDCGHSATTMRLLAGALAAAGIPAVLDGSEGLRGRPMNRIVQPLEAMGASVSSDEGHAPLRFAARQKPLKAGRFALNIASAQVKSCLLLAGLAADGPVEIIEPGPSRDHTERMLRSMGAQVDSAVIKDSDAPQVYQTVLHATGQLAPLELNLPGDFSSAAFLITAALITPGSDLTLRGVGLNPTRTGLLDAYRAMGADVEVNALGDRNGEPIGDLRVRSSHLRGTSVDGALVVRMIDEFPAFASAAAYASGETVVREAEELRRKESDRIHALCTQMRAIGVDIEEREDGFRIKGGRPPSGGMVDPQGDHRIAMALACAGLAARGAVRVLRPEIIRESYPAFVPTLEALGARFD